MLYIFSNLCTYEKKREKTYFTFLNNIYTSILSLSLSFSQQSPKNGKYLAYRGKLTIYSYGL